MLSLPSPTRHAASLNTSVIGTLLAKVCSRCASDTLGRRL